MKQKSSIVKEIADTSQSSWIINASYVTPDCISGSLIIKTSSDEEYIHVGVPKTIWERFKNSSSKGSSYNRHIRNRYKCFRLN